MTTIRKTDLVQQVTEKVGNDTKIENIVSAVFAAIMNNVVEGNEVTITGFGKFKSVQRKERKGRNPKTGEEITIPAQRRVSFTVGKIFKGKVK